MTPKQEKLNALVLLKLKEALSSANAWEKMLLEEAIYEIEENGGDYLWKWIANPNQWTTEIVRRCVDAIEESENIIDDIVDDAIEELKEDGCMYDHDHADGSNCVTHN